MKLFHYYSSFSLNIFKWIPVFIGIIFVSFFSPTRVSAQSASLSLEPATGTFNQGCDFTLNVILDAAGVQTDGADAILFYDASKFTANSITKGAIYPDFPGNNIDAVSGKITISGLASVDTPFSGKGILSSVKFTVKSNASIGATQITFDFDPVNKAKTTDSNVVQRTPVVDVLNSVVNGSYIVGTGVCGGGASPVPRGAVTYATPSATQAPPVYIPRKELPEGGTAEFTSMLAIMGGVLTVLGILGLALL